MFRDKQLTKTDDIILISSKIHKYFKIEKKEDNFSKFESIFVAELLGLSHFLVEYFIFYFFSLCFYFDVNYFG